MITFGRLRSAVLKVNAPKCRFGLKDIPYLGYVIIQGGIKPDPKKAQGIIDTRRPTTITKAQEIIGMVHHYRDM